MSPATLTRTTAYQWEDAFRAIRLSVDTLVTRTALYAWDDGATLWMRTTEGLRVRHAAGWRWETKAQRFVLCRCTRCAPCAPCAPCA